MSTVWPIRPAIAAGCARGSMNWQPQRPPDAPQGPAWLVVEKILGAGEHLPDDWAVDGTSGYDFMDQVSALLHDGSGETALRRLWGELSGRPTDFAEEEERGAARCPRHAFCLAARGGGRMRCIASRSLRVSRPAISRMPRSVARWWRCSRISRCIAAMVSGSGPMRDDRRWLVR